MVRKKPRGYSGPGALTPKQTNFTYQPHYIFGVNENIIAS